MIIYQMIFQQINASLIYFIKKYIFYFQSFDIIIKRCLNTNLYIMKLISIFFFLCILFSAYSKQPYFNKNVWVFWNKPIVQAPLFVQLCYQKLKMVCQKENYNLTLLTDDNYHLYIPDFQHFMQMKKKMKHPEWLPQVGDLVRLTILQANGGVWFDLSTILFDGLKWLEQLQKYPYLLTNSQIQNNIMPDMLAPYLSYYQSKSQKRDSQGRISKFLPGYQAWFMAARKQSPAITGWLRNFQQVFQRNTQQNAYYQRKYDYWTKFLKGDYLNVDKSMHQVIQKKQFQLDKNISLIRQRKNANKQYRIIGFHGQYGPFAVYLDIVPNKNIVLTHTVQQIAQQYYVYINFFLKFTNVDRPYYQKKINTIIELNKKFNNINEHFQEFLDTKPTLTQCRQVVFIVEGSIFASLVKNNKVAIDNKIVIITKEQQAKWAQYCSKLTQQNQFFQHQNDYDENQQSYLKKYFFKLMNYLVHKKYITTQRRAQIHMYIFGNGMGQFADVQKVFYWRKLYQQKNSNQLQTSSNKVKLLSQYSFFQMLVLNVKLSLISYRRYIKSFFQFLQMYTEDIINASYIMFLSLFAFNSMLIFFYILFILLSDRKRLFNKIKQICKKFVEKINYVRQGFIQQGADCLGQNTLKFIVFLGKQSGLILFRLFFVSFYAYIVMKFNEICIDGESQDQQTTIITMIFIQIILRKIIFHLLNKDIWFLPGIKLQQAYRIFLPLYFYYLGSSIVQFAQKKQSNNFGSGFPICFVMPVLFQQIQFQSKKIYEKNRPKFMKSKKSQDNSQSSLLNIENNQLYIIYGSNQIQRRYKVIYSLQYIFSNITTLIQLSVVYFLFVLLLIPNLRYVIIGQTYLMKHIVSFVWYFGQFFFFILVILYCNDLKYLVRELIMNTNKKQLNNSTRSKNNASQVYLKQQIEQQIRRQKVIYKNKLTSLSLESNDIVCKCSLKIGYNIFILILLAIKYGLNIYSYFLLIISPLPYLAYQNHQEIWKPQVIPVILLIFVNYSLEKFIDYLVFNIKYSNWAIFSQNKSQTKNNSESAIQRQSYNQSNQNLVNQLKNPYKSYSISLIIMISLMTFQIARLYFIDKIFTYFHVISQKRFDLRWQNQKLFPQYIQTMMTWTLIGYALLKVIVNYVYNKKLLSLLQNQQDNDKGIDSNMKDIKQAQQQKSGQILSQRQELTKQSDD